MQHCDTSKLSPFTTFTKSQWLVRTPLKFDAQICLLSLQTINLRSHGTLNLNADHFVYYSIFKLYQTPTQNFINKKWFCIQIQKCCYAQHQSVHQGIGIYHVCDCGFSNLVKIQ